MKRLIRFWTVTLTFLSACGESEANPKPIQHLLRRDFTGGGEDEKRRGQTLRGYRAFEALLPFRAVF